MTDSTETDAFCTLLSTVQSHSLKPKDRRENLEGGFRRYELQMGCCKVLDLEPLSVAGGTFKNAQYCNRV